VEAIYSIAQQHPSKDQKKQTFIDTYSKNICESTLRTPPYDYALDAFYKCQHYVLIGQLRRLRLTVAAHWEEAPTTMQGK
jgi:hypothetical protein